VGAPHDSPPLLAIVGPTGVGKTAGALALCGELGGEIIGADSVQVYRGFDIGSSKPTAAQLGDVRHHLIDVCAPDEAIDAMRYAGLADEAIRDARARGRVPIVVGGTGLWIRALLRGLLSVPPADPELRRELEQRYAREGAAAMHAALRAIDPRTAEHVHPNDQLRVVRALEVHAQTGEALGELRHAHALGAPRYDALTLYADVPSAHHRPTLEARVDQMIAAGWADEVRTIVAAHGRQPRALGAVGYRQMLAHVDGAASLEETRDAIVGATAGYARRQRTWFNSDPAVSLRLTPAELLETEALARIRRHLRSVTIAV